LRQARNCMEQKKASRKDAKEAQRPLDEVYNKVL